MYTQSFNVQDSSGLKSVTPPAVENPEAQARFDHKIDADGKIEPQDWMPDGYRKTRNQHFWLAFCISILK